MRAVTGVMFVVAVGLVMSIRRLVTSRCVPRRTRQVGHESIYHSLLCVLAIVIWCVGTSSQARTTKDEGRDFDVASIKPRQPATRRELVEITAERFRMSADRIHRAAAGEPETDGRWYVRYVTLRDVLAMVYPEYSGGGRIMGGPDWVDSRHFDIDARAAESSTQEQLRGMAGRLLADRFRLRLRRTTRAMDAYALTVARKDTRLGPGLRPSVECDRSRFVPSPVQTARPTCQLALTFDAGVPTLVGGASTIEELAQGLQSRVARPIVDRTGLSGAFAIRFVFPPAAPLQANPADDVLSGTFFLPFANNWD